MKRKTSKSGDGSYRGDGANEERIRRGGRRRRRRGEEADMSGQSEGGGGFEAMKGMNLDGWVGEDGGVRGAERRRRHRREEVVLQELSE